MVRGGQGSDWVTAITILIKFNLPPSSLLPRGWQVAGSIMKTDILPSGHRESLLLLCSWLYWWMLKGTMSSLPWPRDGNAPETLPEYWGVGDRASLGGGQERHREEIVPEYCIKWGLGNPQMEGKVVAYVRKTKSRKGLWTEERNGLSSKKLHWALFSTSSFPICNQRKELLTKGQRRILNINLYTDKQQDRRDLNRDCGRSTSPSVCTEANPEITQGHASSGAIQHSRAALSCLSILMSPAPLPGHEPSVIPPPAQN